MTKGSNAFDSQLVLDQLRYLGMLEIIRIRKQGFPVHYQFGEFLQKYHCLSVRNRKQKGLRPPANDERAAAKALLQAEGMPPREWQIGKTKLFLRGCVHEPLEERRLAIINAMATKIQKVWKGQRLRKDFLRKRSAAKNIQECYLTWRLRIRFLRQRRAAVVIQSHLRGMFAREVANALREAKRVEEERRRKELLEEERRKRQLEVEEERKRREAAAAAAAAENGDGSGSNGEGRPEELQGEAGDEFGLDRKKSFAGLADLDQGEAEKELQKLSQLAGQLNPKLIDASSNDHSANNVDLDQLFNFLSGEAASTIASESVAGSNSEAGGNRSSILDEIDRQMSDLQNEIDQYSIEEGMTNREMSPPPLPPPSALPATVSQPPPMQLGKPSLPEPEGPPPPPPVQNGYAFNTPHLSQEVRNPLKINKQDPNKPKEPIYESIKPRPEPVGGNEDPPPPESLPPPPPPQQLQQQPSATLTSAVVPPPIVTPLPPQNQRPQQVSNNSAGVYQGRQNNKRQRRQQLQQQQQQQQQLQQQILDPEREARRMERVKRGLEKIQEESNIGSGGGDLFEEFSMLEFAENFFNDHEKCSPQSTIVGTLKRRGSKANLMDILSKEDMIQHFKGSAIPTSHIHLYDPENVNIAVRIFREVLKYSRGELKTADAEVTAIQDIIRHGIEVEELRDEIYVQCVRQLTNNPCEEQNQRLWLLLCLVVVAFTPSKAFFKVHDNSPDTSVINSSVITRIFLYVGNSGNSLILHFSYVSVFRKLSTLKSRGSGSNVSIRRMVSGQRKTYPSCDETKPSIHGGDHGTQILCVCVMKDRSSCHVNSCRQ